jgi:putative ABC transport system permease protein
MISSYFKMAWRSLTKNRLFSFINIGGLSVGLATGIIILLVITDELSYDHFHRNLKDIYVLMRSQNLNGNINTGRAVPGQLAAAVRSEIPEVKYVARISDESGQLIKAGDKTLYETAMYTDPDFLRMLSFQAVEGDAIAALQDPGSAVITESMAKALFGAGEALGKPLILNNKNPLKVAAVIRDVPKNSSIRFDMVLPFRIFEQGNDWLKKWDDNRIQTWVQVQPGADPGVLNSKLKKLFLEKQDEKNVVLFAYPFARLRLHGQFKNGEPSGGVIYIVMMLSFIGGFVLLIACINFMNLTTARSERRAREVGVRKVLGASRKLIILQFLSEAFLLSFLALLLGILLARIALPGFMRLSGKQFVPDFSNIGLWLLLIGMGLVTALVAGSYPAFYLSRFQPVKVLKNWIPAGGAGGLLRKILVTFQFSISIFLIIATIVIYKQIDYVERRPIGYQADHLIDIPARGEMSNNFNAVKNELMSIPGVKEVSAGGDNLIEFGGAFNGLEWPGKTPDQDFYIKTTSVQYGWVKTAGLKLTEGRDFSPAFGADSMSCLINETAARKMNLKKPIVGTKLGNNTVIGVIHDFVMKDPSAAPPPIIVYLGKGSMNHFLVRITNDENWQACLARIEKAVKKVNPSFPVEVQFTDEEYQRNFEQIRSIAEMSNIFGVMAIFISCLGLFGLSAYLAERRGKEISIRKILGAGMGSLWFSLSKDFLKPVIIAFIVAAPLAGWVMQKVLGLMDYHIQLSWWMFVLAGVIVMVIAVVTVSFNGVKATVVNPVKKLRNE